MFKKIYNFLFALVDILADLKNSRQNVYRTKSYTGLTTPYIYLIVSSDNEEEKDYYLS